MAKNRHIIDDIFDLLVLCGKVGKLAICTVLRIEEKYDLELFFKNAGLKNGSGEMPKQKNITTGEKGDVYHLSIPDDCHQMIFQSIN